MEDLLLQIIKKWKPLLGLAIAIFLLLLIANNYKNVIGLWQDITRIFAKKPVHETYSFLLFPNKELYIAWESDINFKTGVPYFDRNAETDKIDTSSKVISVSEWTPHPNKNDKRGICSFDFNSSTEKFVDSLNSEKYKFIKITHRQAENIGIISDEISYNKLKSENEKIGKIADMDSQVFYSNINKIKKFESFTGFNLDIYFRPNLPSDYRNKYFLDYGFETDKNRISYYFNPENELCFRVIDANSNIFILCIKADLNNKPIYLNFKYNTENNTLQVKINNSKLVSKQFSNIDFNLKSPKSVSLGNSLVPYYGAKMSLYYADFEYVTYIPIINKHIVNNFIKVDYRKKSTFSIDDKQGIGKIKNDESEYEVN